VREAGLVPDHPSRSKMLYPRHKGAQGEYMYNPTINSELDA